MSGFTLAGAAAQHEATKLARRQFTKAQDVRIDGTASPNR